MSDDLHIAEVLYESGAIRFRYGRVLAPDESRWLRHGLFVEYAENGAVLSEGSYVRGKEQGLWRDFYANGQVAAEGMYEDGVEKGTWRFWSEVGDEDRVTVFVRGVERA